MSDKYPVSEHIQGLYLLILEAYEKGNLTYAQKDEFWKRMMKLEEKLEEES